MNRSIVYSIAAQLNEGGMSTIAWHACKALENDSLLRLILAQSSSKAEELASKTRDLPWFFQKTMAALNRFGFHGLKDDSFDRWASCWLQKGDDYYGWLHQSLACIRKCHSLGGRTYVDRGSIEPRHQQCILWSEYKKYGLTSQPIGQLSLNRMIDEANETDFIVVPSSFVAESYLDAGYDVKKIKVNQLGVDRSRFVPCQNDERNLGPTRVAYVGQLSIQKGIPLLLQTWKKLNPTNAQLVLAGVIPHNERSVIEPMLENASNIEWTGHAQHIEKLLQTCHALVLPSAQDGFGLVVLEAMACGLPVLVSDRVGARDCIKYGENGWVFCFDKIDSFTAHLDLILRNPNNLLLMRQAALDTAAKYSWENYQKRFVQLWK